MITLHPDAKASQISTGVYLADNHTLRTLGLRLADGRNFSADDVQSYSGPGPSVPPPDGVIVTQQLARTLFLSNVRTFGRKAKEAGIALLIEQQLTKKQILELYLNRVYLSGGVYGVETMSEHLFRKSARTLTLSEAALIAGLIRAPS